MSKEVKITIKAVPRAEPDLSRLARALLLQILAERRQVLTTDEATPPQEAAS